MDQIGECTPIEEETEAEAEEKEEVEAPAVVRKFVIENGPGSSKSASSSQHARTNHDVFEEMKLLSRVAVNVPRDKETTPECDSESPSKSDQHLDSITCSSSQNPRVSPAIAAKVLKSPGLWYLQNDDDTTITTRFDGCANVVESHLDPCNDQETNPTVGLREEADLAFEQMLLAIHQDIGALSLSIDLVQKTKLERIRDVLRGRLEAPVLPRPTHEEPDQTPSPPPPPPAAARSKSTIGQMRITKIVIAIDTLLLLIQRFEEEEVLLALTEVIRLLFQRYAIVHGITPLRQAVALLTSGNMAEVVLLTRRALLGQPQPLALSSTQKDLVGGHECTGTTGIPIGGISTPSTMHKMQPQKRRQQPQLSRSTGTMNKQSQVRGPFRSSSSSLSSSSVRSSSKDPVKNKPSQLPVTSSIRLGSHQTAPSCSPSNEASKRSLSQQLDERDEYLVL